MRIVEHISAALDLTNATAANRRAQTVPTDDYRLSGVLCTFSTTQARDITVSVVQADTAAEVVLSTVSANAATSWAWAPTAIPVSFSHPWAVRVQFSQAGGACSARVYTLTADE